MIENVSPSSYYNAAATLFQVATAVSQAHSDTMTALVGTGSMAGTDDVGDSFAEEYDNQAGMFESMGRNLGPAIHNYGRVLLQMGKNHAAAEADSNIGSGAQPVEPPADPGDPALSMCVALTSAKGGVGEGLSEVIGLLQNIGIPVPNGDTGKLTTASTAWAKVASDSGGGYLGKLLTASESLGDLNGKEVDIVIEDLEELDSLVEEYAELGGALKDSIESHKNYLDDVRSALDDLLESLALDLAVDATITVGLAVVTFGLGATAGGAKIASTLARYGKKIEDMIGRVKRLRPVASMSKIFSKGSAAKSNERLTRFLQMQLKEAKTQGQKNNLNGRIGELKAGIDPNAPKTKVNINGRERIPDEIDEDLELVREVKNTNSIGKTQQIQDMVDYANSRGFTMELVVDDRTKISGPLQTMIDNGEITLKRMALN